MPSMKDLIDNLSGSKYFSCILSKDLSPDFLKVHNETIQSSKASPHEAKQEHDKIRLIQWNCDGIRNKIIELRQRVIDQEIDVILIQETKLEKNHKTPDIPGFAPWRVDRKNKKGGGLIAYIKRSIIFEKKREQSKDTTEIQTLRIKLNKKKWIDVTNLYCPPVSSKAHEDLNPRLATEIVTCNKDALIAGDFNGHSLLWDEVQPPDERGEDIINWVIDEDLSIANDGSPTRINRGTGNESTPDITIHGSSWNNKINWSVDELIGNSDHNPIIIEISVKMRHVSPLNRAAKWKSKDVNWQEFKEEVEKNILDAETAVHWERVSTSAKDFLKARFLHHSSFYFTSTTLLTSSRTSISMLCLLTT